MFFNIKNISKKIFYLFTKKGQLKPYNIKLGYIFHTERLYNDRIFDRLLLFCKAYHTITGAKPICTVIPPSNLQLKKEILENKFPEEYYTSRIAELSKHSTIGYHGHFYLNNDPKDYNAIHCNSYNFENLEEQFSNDLNWFKKNNISHNNIYAAGWWFFNTGLLRLLLAKKHRQNNFSHFFQDTAVLRARNDQKNIANTLPIPYFHHDPPPPPPKVGFILKK